MLDPEQKTVKLMQSRLQNLIKPSVKYFRPGVGTDATAKACILKKKSEPEFC